MAKVHQYGGLSAHRWTVIDQTVEPNPTNASHASVADGPEVYEKAISAVNGGRGISWPHMPIARTLRCET